ncbi:hypothetical protein [Nocardia sp. NPDC050435]|uniref:hypothetical protein n=1 Tax=Nocardia sp. NPDC050435 TaxID=3155040 RepID=UPI0033EB961E
MWEIDQLNQAQLREKFNLDQRWFDTPGFPAGAPDADGTRRWPADQVWAWLASRDPHAAGGVALRYWARGAAIYQHAQPISGGIVQDWTVHGVVLRVLWPTVAASATGRVAAAAAQLTPHARQLIRVRHDAGRHGPGLSAHDETGHLLDGDDNPLWPELALVLGGRAPFWPYELRDPDAMRRWRPGHPPIQITAADGSVNPDSLLRLASILPATDTAHVIALNLAQWAQFGASSNAAFSLGLSTEDARHTAWLDVAATPVPVAEPPELDDVIGRDGWLNIAARTDPLSHEAISQARRSSGHDQWLPYTSAEYIDPRTELGAAWAARQRPCAPYAGFQIVYDHLAEHEQGAITEHLTDPVTDTPAVRLASGRVLAAVPHRLPVESPLAELTLAQPIWIRLADGTVHLAPRRDAPGINWGYAGSGTSTLALLITRLLDDITAPAGDTINGGDHGLQKFLQTDWPAGTTVPRADLDAARTGRT